MRTSNYRKKLHIDKKVWRIAGAGLAALLLAGVIFFFTYYRVENVEVMGSSHYTEEEVREMILRGPLASNSILAPILYSRDDVGDIPFVEGFRVRRSNRNTIVITVREKQPVGCIPYLDSYIYFDRNGIFIESSLNGMNRFPILMGLKWIMSLKTKSSPLREILC